MNIKYVLFFVISLMLLTGCDDNSSSNNSTKYQRTMDNNIGTVENSKINRVTSTR